MNRQTDSLEKDLTRHPPRQPPTMSLATSYLDPAIHLSAWTRRCQVPILSVTLVLTMSKDRNIQKICLVGDASLSRT